MPQCLKSAKTETEVCRNKSSSASQRSALLNLDVVGCAIPLLLLRMLICVIRVPRASRAGRSKRLTMRSPQHWWDIPKFVFHYYCCIGREMVRKNSKVVE